jgi:hypothetical protein
MNLKPLNQGPIVGETTPDRVRIWGRYKHQNFYDYLRGLSL